MFYNLYHFIMFITHEHRISFTYILQIFSTCETTLSSHS